MRIRRPATVAVPLVLIAVVACAPGATSAGSACQLTTVAGSDITKDVPSSAGALGQDMLMIGTRFQGSAGLALAAFSSNGGWNAGVIAALGPHVIELDDVSTLGDQAWAVGALASSAPVAARWDGQNWISTPVRDPGPGEDGFSGVEALSPGSRLGGWPTPDRLRLPDVDRAVGRAQLDRRPEPERRRHLEHAEGRRCDVPDGRLGGRLVRGPSALPTARGALGRNALEARPHARRGNGRWLPERRRSRGHGGRVGGRMDRREETRCNRWSSIGTAGPGAWSPDLPARSTGRSRPWPRPPTVWSPSDVC